MLVVRRKSDCWKGRAQRLSDGIDQEGPGDRGDLLGRRGIEDHRTIEHAVVMADEGERGRRGRSRDRNEHIALQSWPSIEHSPPPGVALQREAPRYAADGEAVFDDIGLTKYTTAEERFENEW